MLNYEADKDILFKTKSFGVIVYMENDMYSINLHANDSIHIPLSKEDFYIVFLKELYRIGLGECPLGNIVIGHEHGKENHKCHFQVFIEFTEKIYKTIRPGAIKVNHYNLLYIAQHSKYPVKLRSYCKKCNDFVEFFPEKKIKEILRQKKELDATMDLDDPYGYIISNSNLNDDDIKKVFRYCNATEHKKVFMVYAKKIYETYNNYIRKEKDVPEFRWLFPEHMYNYVINNNNANDKLVQTYSKIYYWFTKYCAIEQNSIIRRKALFLFSLKGGMGKSFFARGLVPEVGICNSPYYVYCRGTLDASEFLKKANTAKIVILDDINYINNDIEIWKALAVSEPTNIRSPYHNILWNKSLPCVLLSNNIRTLKHWLDTDDLKSRCIFIGIDFYIGPPGTDNFDNHESEFLLTPDIESMVEKLRGYTENKKDVTID